MQIFGIGPLELLFILVIMILVLGPRGMVKAARESGKYIRKITRSPLWAEIMGTSRQIRDLPAKIIKDAGIQDEIDELRRSTLPPTFAEEQNYFKQTKELNVSETESTIKKKSTGKIKKQRTDQPAKQSLRKKDSPKKKQ
jgi:Sec-independent protein translocase protein TatA